MYKNFLFFIFIITSGLAANNFHDQLILTSLDQTHPSWEYNHLPISLRQENSCIDLIAKWNKVLAVAWKKILHEIYLEVRLGQYQIDSYLSSQNFIDVYLAYYKKHYPEVFQPEVTFDIHPMVTNYVQMIVRNLQLPGDITIITKPDMAMIATAFGTAQTGYFLAINTDIICQEKILEFYEAYTHNNALWHIEPATHSYRSRMIETPHLFHLAITQAAINAIHQNDFLSKIFILFHFNKKVLPASVHTALAEYLQLRSYLEASLLSKNPLESAIFLEPLCDDFNQEYILLWREFMQDIITCYDEKDLAGYESWSLHIRQADLFTQN